MTREEAIANIKRGKCIPDKHETLTTIIEALKAEPCEDAISRLKAKELFKEKCVCAFGCCRAYSPVGGCGLLDELPSVQPERPKGEWIEDGLEVRCSVCGEIHFDYEKFCPNCGADMRGEQK